MSRIIVELPDSYIFETIIEIRVSDLNYGKHLGNDAVLSLAQEARVRFLALLGYTEFNIEGAGLLQVDTAIQYKAQGSWGQKLNIEIAFKENGSTGCDFWYRLTDSVSGKEIARVKTGMVFFDYSKQKICRAPDMKSWTERLINPQ